MLKFKSTNPTQSRDHIYKYKGIPAELRLVNNYSLSKFL